MNEQTLLEQNRELREHLRRTVEASRTVREKSVEAVAELLERLAESEKDLAIAQKLLRSANHVIEKMVKFIPAAYLDTMPEEVLNDIETFLGPG